MTGTGPRDGQEGKTHQYWGSRSDQESAVLVFTQCRLYATSLSVTGNGRKICGAIFAARFPYAGTWYIGIN